MKHNTEAPEDSVRVSGAVTRRQFFGQIGTATLGAAAIGAMAPVVDTRASVAAQRGANAFYHQRAQAAFQYRLACAKDNFKPIPALFDRPGNGDEELYPSRIGNYSKGLPHQPNGEVVPSAYNALLEALRSEEHTSELQS